MSSWFHDVQICAQFDNVSVVIVDLDSLEKPVPAFRNIVRVTTGTIGVPACVLDAIAVLAISHQVNRFALVSGIYGFRTE